jgi:hypothetical protein
MRNHLKHCTRKTLGVPAPEADAMYDELLELVYRHLR